MLIVLTALMLTGMLDTLCHYLVVYATEEAMGCHTATLRLPNLHACLPHIKDILASISAIGTAWAKAPATAKAAAAARRQHASRLGDNPHAGLRVCAHGNAVPQAGTAARQ
jgi:hypothetical protein